MRVRTAGEAASGVGREDMGGGALDGSARAAMLSDGDQQQLGKGSQEAPPQSALVWQVAGPQPQWQ